MVDMSKLLSKHFTKEQIAHLEDYLKNNPIHIDAGKFIDSPAQCPDQPHRPPQGPNEDVAQCSKCWSMSFKMRPSNETIGYHLDDCSLPIDHESYCQPGGEGHPPAEIIRE